MRVSRPIFQQTYLQKVQETVLEDGLRSTWEDFFHQSKLSQQLGKKGFPYKPPYKEWDLRDFCINQQIILISFKEEN